MASSTNVSHYFIMAALLIIYGVNESTLNKQEKSTVYYKVCGEQLAQAVADVCNFVYNGKRSENDNDRIPNDLDRYVKYKAMIDAEILSHALQSPRAPSYTSILSSRYKRGSYSSGIVNECCYNRCSYDEMKSYCGSE